MIEQLTFFEIASISAGIATTILVIVVMIQVYLTKTQMNVTLRPWIGITEFKTQGQNIAYGFVYKNFGQTPPISEKISVYGSEGLITKKELLEIIKSEKQENAGIIFPQQTKTYLIGGLEPDKLEKARLGSIEYFLGILIQYKYGKNKEGEYGYIVKYSMKSAEWTTVEQWTR